MSLSKAIFGKEIYDLEIHDVIDFFQNEQEETSVLEFKSGEASLEQIHREVSAFLNTEGGLLIIGTPVEKKAGAVKVCQGDLKPSKHISDQDTLLRSIASNIAPSPVNIKAKSFAYGDGMVFILEVAQSITPPHQVSNEGKYYIRLERDAKAAPHGIVEALFNRRQKPQLAGEIRFLDTTKPGELRIIFSLTNESVITAERAGLLITIYGVKKIKKVVNFHSSYTLKDDKLSIQELLINNLLVKGISVQFSVEVELQNKFGLVDYGFYCKDGLLQSKSCLFTTVPFSFLKKYDTTKDSEADGKSIYDDFRNMQNDVVHEILVSKGQNRITESGSIEDIIGLFDFLGLDLPESLISFYQVSNGFTGTVNGRNLRLFNIQELKKDNIRQGFEQFGILTIGFLDDYPIQLTFEKKDDNDAMIFMWDQVVNGRLITDNKAKSFFEFLANI